MKELFFLIVFFALLQHSSAQSIPDVRVNRLSILIGEPFDVELMADSSKGAPRPFWILPDTIHHFEYLSVDSSKPFRCLIRLTSWDTGFWKPGPIAVSFVSETQTSGFKISIPSVSVRYARYADNTLEDIKPIIHPVPPPSAWPKYLFITAIVCTAIFIIYLYTNRRRKRPVLTIPGRIVRSSNEIRQMLLRFEKESWTSPDIQKKAFIEIRKSVLELLPREEQRIFESKPFRELIHNQQSWLREEMYTQVLEVVQKMDLVIYAKFVAQPEECRKVFQAFISYLDAWDQKQAASV